MLIDGVAIARIYYDHDELGKTLVGDLYLDQAGIDDLRKRLA